MHHEHTQTLPHRWRSADNDCHAVTCSVKKNQLIYDTEVLNGRSSTLFLVLPSVEMSQINNSSFQESDSALQILLQHKYSLQEQMIQREAYPQYIIIWLTYL